MPWHTHRASHICISLHCGTTSDLPKLTLKVQCVYWLWTFVLTQLKVNTTLVNLPVCCLAASSISLPIFQRFVTASILGGLAAKEADGIIPRGTIYGPIQGTSVAIF